MRNSDWSSDVCSSDRGGRIRRFWSDRLGSGGRLSIGGAVRLPLLGDDQPIISEPVGTPGRIRLFQRIAALAIAQERLGNAAGAGDIDVEQAIVPTAATGTRTNLNPVQRFGQGQDRKSTRLNSRH